MAKIALTTLGCKANWVDGEDLIRSFACVGLEIVPFDEIADVYVINSCTVTSVADQQSRQLIRRARRKNPSAIVIACGCMGEVSRDETASMPEVDAVFGTSDRSGVARYVCEKMGLGIVSAPIRVSASASIRDQSRARAFFKIQDGCDKRCAYCIVPSARGKSRSVNPEVILNSCLKLARHHREIVLTGIDIGQYGKNIVNPCINNAADTHGCHSEPLRLRSGQAPAKNPVPSMVSTGFFADAQNDIVCIKEKIDLMGLLQFLARAGNLPRIRISSIDPTVVDERFVELISSGKVCRHVHLSIQSGSDSVLKRMGRRYGADEIRRAVKLLTENIPHIAIGGDIIAGFPGETDDEHKRTFDLISNLPLASLHVFPYSERKETVAADMPDRIPHKIRRARAGELRDAAAQLRRKFLQGIKGSLLDVIVTSRAADECGMVSGFSDNAVSVSLPAGTVGYSQMGRVIVTEVFDLGVKGIWK